MTGVPITRFSGRVHRQTAVDTPCFPPPRPAPAPGRYHRIGDAWPLYASLDPTTAWAEWRAATAGAIDPATERRRLWRIDARDLAVVDLRDADVRAALGVDVAQLTGARARCQALARRAHRLGAEGLVVPSAAAPDGWNLVVFPSGFGALKSRGSAVRNPAPPPAD